MNQWELEANTRNWRQARENLRDQVAISFEFAYPMWSKFFKSIITTCIDTQL